MAAYAFFSTAEIFFLMIVGFEDSINTFAVAVILLGVQRLLACQLESFR